MRVCFLFGWLLLFTIQPLQVNAFIIDSLPALDFRDVGFNVLRKLHLSPTVDTSMPVRPAPKLLFACIPGIGYTLTTGLTFVVSNNLSFYAGNKFTTGLSSMTTNAEFSIYDHQVIIPLASNIWTKNNTFNLLGDWRYLRYPSNTFGLGGYSSVKNAEIIDYNYLRIYQEALKKVKGNVFLGLGYNLDYHWHIHELGKGDFQSYNQFTTSTHSSGIILHFLYDGRDNVNNPEPSHFASITYRINPTFLGSDNNWQSLQVDLRKYISFPSHASNVLAFWSYAWLTFGNKVPYFELPSTGWDTYSSIGRGYIQGRLRAPNLVYLESEYRFNITKNGLLGGVVFINAQSVTELNTHQFSTILPGEGIGCRFKINKHSKVNFCVDYGFGNEGSKGFFFNICEYF